MNNKFKRNLQQIQDHLVNVDKETLLETVISTYAKLGVKENDFI